MSVAKPGERGRRGGGKGTTHVRATFDGGIFLKADPRVQRGAARRHERICAELRAHIDSPGYQKGFNCCPPPPNPSGCREQDERGGGRGGRSKGRGLSGAIVTFNFAKLQPVTTDCSDSMERKHPVPNLFPSATRRLVR